MNNNADVVENHEIVILMANMINYLSVSFYESLFTYNHEQARAELNAIYESVVLKCSEPPSLDDSINFHRNIIYLRGVTDTDDATYHTYMRQLKSYIQKLKESSL
jgi:beta-glucosidase/6-phospho-beta-glucosidase/beta-galactosidase